MKKTFTSIALSKVWLCLLLVLGASGYHAKAAQISGTSGTRLLITLNNNDESATIVSNANGYVITFSSLITGTAPGVTITNFVFATITSTGKALYPEIKIVNEAGKTGTSVTFNNSISDYTNNWNIELYDNPTTIALTGKISFIGNSGMKITTQSSVALGTNNTPIVTFEDGDFEVSANMQPTEGTRGGPGFSMWGNARLQMLGSGNIKITARSNAIWQNMFGGPIVIGIYISDGSSIIGGIGGTVELNAYSPRTPNILWDRSNAMYIGSTSNNPSVITSKGANIIINANASLRQVGLSVGDKGSILVDSVASLTINAYGSSSSTVPNTSAYGLQVSGNSLSTCGRIGSLGTGDVTINGYGGGNDTAGSCIGIIVGASNNNQTFPGIITANGGVLRIKGVGSTVSNGLNQHGVFVVGNNSIIESKGGKLIIEGVPGTGTGGGYGIVTARGGLISTTSTPADIDLIVPSMANFNGNNDFLNVGSGKTIKILPPNSSTDFEIGGSAVSLNGKIGLTANDLLKIKGSNGAKLILGGNTHTGDIIFKGNVSNTNIIVEAGSAGSTILPLGIPTDFTPSTPSWSFSNGAKMKFDLTNDTVDIGYDRFAVDGSYDLSGLSAIISGTYVPAPQDTLQLVSVSGTLTGQFSNRGQGAVVNVNGKGMRFHYTNKEVLLIDTTPIQSPSPQVTLTASNNGNAVCPGTPITFTASAQNGGTSPTFAFFKNNVQVQSGSGNSWTLNNPTQGDVIQVVLTSSEPNINPTTDTSTAISISVKSTTSSTTNLSICPSQIPYSWNGLTFNASGSQTKTGLTNAAGCDSSATLNLTVKSATSSITNLSICPSQIPYFWNGLTFNASGSQTKTGLTNAAGCDSSATLNLTVKTTSTSTTNLNICPAQLPYVWNGLTFNTSGSQTKTGLINAAGCDSSATLILSIQNADTSINHLSICVAQLPYVWNGLTFNAAGTQTKFGLTSVAGCDSAATLVLSVNQPSSSTTNLTICDNQLPYSWNGLTFTASGTQTKTGLTNVAGCDSSATLILSVNSSSNSVSNLTICDNQLPYLWNGLTFTTAGTQTKTGLTNALGCDSSATLLLFVNPTSNSTTHVNICSFQLPYSWNGLTFNSGGTQTKTGLTNVAGCDSSATLNLSVYPAYGDTSIQNACVQYVWHGTTYTQSGFYQDTLISSVGCDSIVSLQLTIHLPESSNFSQTSCGSYVWNNVTYTNTGVYLNTFSNRFGCDSVVTLSLTINPIVTPSVILNASADTVCIGANATFTATATNGGPSPLYNFKVNGNSVQNGGSNTYNTAILANNDTITVAMTANNTCQSSSMVTSANKIMTVNPILTPSVTLTSTKDTICFGSAVTFTASATHPGVGALYEFYLNNNSVQSGTGTTYANSSLSNQDSVWVILTATNICQSAGTSTSSKKKITVNALPNVALGTISDMAISADSIAISFSPAGGTLSGPGLNGNIFRPYLVDTGLVTLTYTYTNAQGCSGVSSRSFMILNEAIVWDGSQWKYGTPGATQGSRDLMVLSGVTPVLSNNSACRNLVLRGGSLTHGLNSLLSINGDLNLRGGSLNGGGTLRFNNAASVVTSSVAQTEFRADVEVPAGTNVQNINAFRLAPGSNVMAGSGTPNGGGTTSGSWTLVQRGSTQLNSWNAFSSPVAGATGRAIQGLQHFSFDPTSQTWQAWDSNLVMATGRGYITRFASNGWFRGALNNGNYNVSVVKNTTGSSWNLIGNPYPSQISWADFLAANAPVNGTAYFMKSNVNVNGVVNDYTAINGLMINAEVPVHQGFFVEANASGNVSFSNSMRRAGRTAFYTKTNQVVDLIYLQAMRANDSAQASHTVVGFKADATNGFDRMYDGRLLKGDGNLFVYSLLNQEPMAIQGFPTLANPLTIPLGIDAGVSGEVVFSLDSTNMATAVQIHLEDLLLNRIHNLRQTAYRIQVPAGQAQTGRFRLLVNHLLTNTPSIASAPLRLFAFNTTLVIDQLEGRKLKDVRLTDLSGRTIANWLHPQGEGRIELSTQAAQGAYLLTAETTDGLIYTERIAIIK